MAATVEQLKREYPEFSGTDDQLVADKIADATLQLNPAAYGAQLDKAVMLLACHKLALAPSVDRWRTDPKKKGDPATTSYMRQLDDLGCSLSIVPTVY